LRYCTEVSPVAAFRSSARIVARFSQMMVVSAGGEWQWRSGSGGVGKRRSGRFEWYQIECGSGSIGGDMVD
jgi:hypothetical protein